MSAINESWPGGHRRPHSDDCRCQDRRTRHRTRRRSRPSTDVRQGLPLSHFEAELNDAGITLILPTVRGEKIQRPHTRFLKPFRQIIESGNQTLKAQLDLERHGGRKPAGVCARVLQRILALAAAIWHNEPSGATGPARVLLAYDH